MKILILLITLMAVICVVCYCKREKFTQAPLRDPSHLAANVFRASNTILAAAGAISVKLDDLTLPDSVKDNYNEWIEKGFVSPIKDQMLCGGCWAFATCATLADRLTICTNGAWYPPFGLSEQVMISCGAEMNMDFYQGCNGGIPQFAINALAKEGVPADSECIDCGSQGSGGGGTQRSGGVVNPNDASTCSSGGNVYAQTDYTFWQTGCDGENSCSLSAASSCPCDVITAQMEQAQQPDTPFNVKYKAADEAHNYTLHGDNDELDTVDLWPNIPPDIIKGNVERMKKAIYYEGPLTVGYRVTNDFYTYWQTASKDNYYKYDGSSAMAGGHAVCIVGWKKMKNGTPVWICKNSWGANGGYGFPDGPKWKDPVTGKEVVKYLGGFWNHIMGENDSFIESNASGPRPDIWNPEITKYLPNGGADIPKDWYETMTVRDIYEMTKSGGGGDTPQPPQPVTPISEENTPPLPQPIEISSDKFSVINLTPVNISPESISDFFSNGNNLYMIGSNNSSTLIKAMNYLPNKSELSQADVQQIIDDLSENVQGYLVIAARGDANNYWYIDGNPQNWTGIFGQPPVKRAATNKKFVAETFNLFEGLRIQAPIVQLSSK